MAGKKSVWIVLAVVVVALGAWLATGYNRLITSQLSVQTAWSQVEATYQRRMDLIPNIVNTVKGSSEFEKSTLEGVTAARTQWMNAGSIDQKVDAAQNFDSALSRLLVTVEAYPQLKSTEAYRDLITELEGTENRITVARRDFNDAVKGYNVVVLRFPGNVVAKLFGFSEEKFFTAEPGSEKAPSVDFTK